MILVCKALLLLLFELIIEYIFGTILTKLLLKKTVHPLENLLMGFIFEQALFQIVALGFTFTTGVLHQLSIVWSVIVGIMTIAGIVWNREIIVKQMKNVFSVIKENKVIFACTAIVVLAFCYYVSINGEMNEDARYYIGLMNTTVDTDSLFRYNVYNGYEVDSLYLRRALVTFEVHAATISQLTQIHPLIIARIFRACQNVILTSAAVCLCSQELFWKRESRKMEKSLMTVVCFWIMQLIFADTIYTPATFVLYRAYEAKAFTANLLVLVGLFLCVKSFREKNIKRLTMIGIFLWGCMAISTSAVILAIAECTILLLGMQTKTLLFKEKKEKTYAG